MNVSATGSAVSQAQLAQAQIGSAARRGKDPLQVAAGALGLSKADLVTQLKDGKSLDDVAAAQGVSHDDLAAALKAAMPTRPGTGTGTDADVDTMISRMTSQKGLPTPPAGGRGPGGPGGPGGPAGAGGPGGPGGAGAVGGGSLAQLLSSATDDDEDDDSTTSASSTLTALSKLLDMEPADLVDSLTQGTSLADLVTSKGISSQSLAGVVQEGLLVDAKL